MINKIGEAIGYVFAVIGLVAMVLLMIPLILFFWGFLLVILGFMVMIAIVVIIADIPVSVTMKGKRVGSWRRSTGFVRDTERAKENDQSKTE